MRRPSTRPFELTLFGNPTAISTGGCRKRPDLGLRGGCYSWFHVELNPKVAGSNPAPAIRKSCICSAFGFSEVRRGSVRGSNPSARNGTTDFRISLPAGSASSRDPPCPAEGRSRRAFTSDGSRCICRTLGRSVAKRRETDRQVGHREPVQVPRATARDLLGLGAPQAGELPLEAQSREFPDDAPT